MLIDFKAGQDFSVSEIYTNGGGASSEGTSDTAPGTHSPELTTVTAALNEIIDVIG